MTREEAWRKAKGCLYDALSEEEADKIIKALEQELCEMTVEEYRQRMIQAFHNADCGELIALVVLPTEKEFEHLEWLLKNHYKKEPYTDTISRTKVLKIYDEWFATCNIADKKESPKAKIKALPSVTSKLIECEDCVSRQDAIDTFYKYPNVSWTTLDILEKINSLPPVTPTEKMGHWIKTKVRGGMTMPCCSLCGNETGTIYEYDYCPWCGSKMMQEGKE